MREAGEPLPDFDDPDFGPLFDRFAAAKVVLLGEATHGTSEFYRARATITGRLIEAHGFTIVAVEADWPDAASIDRYVRHKPPLDVYKPAFRHFPTWMWRYTDVDAFVRWLRKHNADRPPQRRAGFYGLDLYNLSGSIRAVIDYLDKVDPEAAKVARERYGCLKPWQNEPQTYGRMALRSGYALCEKPIVKMLSELLEKQLRYAEQDREAFLDAAQNARLIRDAEVYYRVMYYGAAESWNLRDRHMFETLLHLLDAKGKDAKAVIWAHNSHIGKRRIHRDGNGARRAEHRSALPGRIWPRCGSYRFRHACRDRRGSQRLGCADGAQARQSVASRQLRAARTRCGCPALPARSPGGNARRAAGAAPRTEARALHRRDLSTRDRTLEPLLRSLPARAVRRLCVVRPDDRRHAPPDGAARGRRGDLSVRIVGARPGSASMHAVPYGFDLQGHRGARGLYPENTVAGFSGAIGLGADTLELDVAVTADDVVVVSHDPCLNPDITRGPDGAWLERPTPTIRALTISALSAYEVGRIRPGTAYAAMFPEQKPLDGQRIPALAQVFALDRQVRFNVELKTFPDRPQLTVPPEVMADLVVATATAAGVVPRISVQSFDWGGLRHLRRHHPEITLGWLTQCQSDAERRRWWDGAAAADHGGSVPRAVAAEGGPTWSPQYQELTEELVAEAHALALRVVPWCVNDSRDMARLIAWNVDGLITDQPDRARQVLISEGAPELRRRRGIAADRRAVLKRSCRRRAAASTR
jgi:erythromycin esterase-like protein/glycerophosphoryl diester phosphodiesterase